jgi:NH3-dependent NAD+ synthetase
MPILDVNALIDERVTAISDYHRACGIERAELDLSGGVDSAVMAGLLVLAIGPGATTMVYSSINSGSETQSRAQVLAQALGVSLVVHDLSATYEAMVNDMRQNLVASGVDAAALDARIAEDPTILGSIRSCLRAPLGRGYLRMTGNGLRHGTGNECEDRWLRFYQKGGDGEVDTNPIAMLSKGEVFQLALRLGERLKAQKAFAAIIAAPPTPELWGTDTAHTDEDEIGRYLGLSDCGHTFYSYINLIDGQYARVGLIERVARFVDTEAGGNLFDDGLDTAGLSAIKQAAKDSEHFAGVTVAVVETLLAAARRTERVTRHKYNPNCPTLGDRGHLLDRQIITDILPSI